VLGSWIPKDGSDSDFRRVSYGMMSVLLMDHRCCWGRKVDRARWLGSGRSGGDVAGSDGGDRLEGHQECESDGLTRGDWTE